MQNQGRTNPTGWPLANVNPLFLSMPVWTARNGALGNKIRGWFIMQAYAWMLLGWMLACYGVKHPQYLGIILLGWCLVLLGAVATTVAVRRRFLGGRRRAQRA